MIKNIIAGMAVGIANVIPGVSGGTMMVLMGVFNKIMEAIPGIMNFKSPKWKEYFIFLVQLGIGVVVGLVGFANILEYLFEVAPTQTMYWFIGLVAFSIPVFVKKEMKGLKFSVLPFIIGMAVVIGLEVMNPGDVAVVNPEFPPLTISHLITMTIIGVIGGFSMFLPGVSGSMVLLILGYYYLFKSYLADVLTFRLDVLFPLGFMALGILIGIVLSAWILDKALKNSKQATISLLLGLIVASTFVLIYQTLSATFTVSLIMTSALAFLIGGAIVILLDKVVA